MTAAPLLSVRGLGVRYATPKRLFQPARSVRAVDDVSFDLAPGEILSVVGESGCGKSTLGRAVLNLVRPSAGEVVWDGTRLGSASHSALRQLRRQMTIIFQDPLAALDPSMTVGALVREPLDIFEPRMPRGEKERLVADALQRVGLPPEAGRRYPHQFSGGQCQRIGIARAIILKPKMILCDEPVSALDVSVQAQIVRLLERLRTEEGVSLLFISHNLAVVRQISDRVMVLYLGKVMELAGRTPLYETPRHPYTRALLSAVPIPDPARERARKHVRLTGELPSAANPPSGCVFHTRCPHKIERCISEVPILEDAGPGHQVACHRWREPLDPAPV